MRFFLTHNARDCYNRTVTSYVRVFACAVAALAFCRPAGAEAPAATAAPSPAAAQSPTAVVVRIDGGINFQHRWLWYERDGTALFEGLLPVGRGRFRSRVDYAKVERLVAGAELCTRDAAVVHSAGMDVFSYRLGVRCGDRWRVFTTFDAFTPAGGTRVLEAARGLSRLASTLDWSRTDDPVPPDLGQDLRPVRP
jgi:hypothetical protein